ncbi:Protein of unknown function [Pyronema omphalodes CBS 100304]|uniref:Uncharacterized protein n=1 Tax=Pyronema omphalodes (strain CBS 100304) TaxID=1076935 RepID=U4KXW5_PYROM|nr:Protein of unknown function [Pyronema omphalodes CBS 100304]
MRKLSNGIKSTGDVSFPAEFFGPFGALEDKRFYALLGPHFSRYRASIRQ